MDATEILQQGLTELAAVFQARRVPYALAGGLAVSYRSISRSTEDIDLLAANRERLDIGHIRATLQENLPEDDPLVAACDELIRQHYERSADSN